MLKRFELRLAELASEQVRLAAQAHRDGAKARAPVDTGRLRDSIRVEAEGSVARVIADCEYAGAVEFGTSRNAPQPFMRG